MTDSRIDKLKKVIDEHDKVINGIQGNPKKIYKSIGSDGSDCLKFFFQVDNNGELNISNGILNPKEALKLIDWLKYWYEATITMEGKSSNAQ